MSYLSEILTALPVNTEFKVCATLVELDKAWQCCERFGSHAIKIRQGCVAGEFIVRIIPHHDEIDDDGYSGDVVQVAVSLAGVCAVFYVFIGWCFS